MYSIILASFVLVHVAVAGSNCGGEYRGSQYKVTSPNYPRNYGNRQNCLYNLLGDCDDQEFHLHFQEFNVRASESCRGDFLQVGKGHVFCGTVVGLRKFSGSRNLTLKFHSDDKETDKGFKIMVKALPCDPKLGAHKNPFNKEFEDNKPSWSINKNNPNDFNQRDIRGDNDGKNDSNAPFKIDLSTPNDSHMNSPSSNVEVKDNPSITSYLFVPPNESNGTPFNSKIKSDNYNSVTLSGELLPPGPNPAKIFSKISKDKLPSSTWDKSSSVIIPARNYGDPGFGVVDYDIQVGNRDCDKKRIPPSIIGHNYDHVSNYNPTLGQGFPSSNNKLDSPTNAIYDPHQGLIQQSNGWGSNYPQWGGNIPNIPPNWGGNVPNIPPNWGANINSPSWNGNINDPGWGECCRLPTSRRFSIVSPGFPGGSSNAYSCRYTIVKSSPEVTSLRLNFRFFNLGSEDPFCSNGHLEIDGQLFCGCKSGQTYQTLFTDFSPKIITVTYSDFPRSKFSGFLIDVYQDSFSPNPNNYPPPNQINSPYPQYPIVYPPASPINSPYPQNPNTYDPASQINSPHPGFLRRHERMLDNSTDIVPSPLDPLYHKINKRNVGYTYSKPNVPFNLDTRYNNPEIIVGKSHERFFGGGSCQSRIFWDWIVASKESILRNVRCNAAYGFNSRSYLPPDNSKADRKPY